MRKACDLQVRAHQQTYGEVSSASSDPLVRSQHPLLDTWGEYFRYQYFMQSLADQAAWRLIDIGSLVTHIPATSKPAGPPQQTPLGPVTPMLDVPARVAQPQPFRVRLSWLAGHGSDSVAYFSVASRAQVCVWAKSLRIEVQVLSRVDPTTIAAHIADSDVCIPTHNHLEVLDRGVYALSSVPPYASSVRVERADASVALDVLLASNLEVIPSDPSGSVASPIGFSVVRVKTLESMPETPVAGARAVWVKSVTGEATIRTRTIFTLSL